MYSWDSTSFNGATIFQPWKFVGLCSLESKRRDPLQWGHDFSTVEMAEKADDEEEQPDASMGPRFFNRGNGGHFSTPTDAEKLAIFERFIPGASLQGTG